MMARIRHRSLIGRGEMGFSRDRGFAQTHAHALKKKTAHRQLKAKKIRADNACSNVTRLFLIK